MESSSLAYAYTEPVREFARKRGISPTKVYDWIEQGLIESFLEGKRRHIVVSSYDRLVRQRVAEQKGGARKLPSSNPKVRARQAAAYADQSVAKQRSGVAARPHRSSGTGRRS